MKFSQIAAIVVTLLISLVVVMWLASSAPEIDDGVSNNEPADPTAPIDTPTEEGVHNENPFELTAEGPHPKAVIEKQLHDFGSMALGQTGHYDFVIKNEGEAPLKLAKGQVQCKCTVSGLQDELVPVGGEANIHLEYTPKSMGRFGQGAVIWTNDPENEMIEVRVEGEMVSEINLNPENGWIFATVPSGRPVPLNGSISTALQDSFDIVSIETSSKNVVLKAEPLSAEELEEQNAKSGYRFVGEYEPGDEAGSFNEKVTVKTTLDKHAKIVLSVSGNRAGPVAIIAPGWYAGERLLDLERISEKKGVKRRLTLMVEPFDEQMEVTDMQVTPEFVEVDLKAEKNSDSAARHRYSMMVEVPPDSPPGVWQRGNLGKIVLKTNHPKLKEIVVNLKMVIQ